MQPILGYFPPHLWPIVAVVFVGIFAALLYFFRTSPIAKNFFWVMIGGSPEETLRDVEEAQFRAGEQADQLRGGDPSQQELADELARRAGKSNPTDHDSTA